MEHLDQTTLSSLRKNALNAFLQGVQAAEPQEALRNAFVENPLPTCGSNGQYYIIAIGKAACKMADYTIKHLPPNSDFKAIAVTNFENVQDVKNCEVIGASHPIPCEKGLLGARKIERLLTDANEQDVVLFMVSGGASALVPSPVKPLTLHDKIELNQLLLANGFDIYQTNLIRQSVSNLKGGGALRMAAPATVHSYILSDVLGDDLRVIGSGPSIKPIGTIADARRLLITEGVFTKLPANIRNYLETETSPAFKDYPNHAHLIAGNTNSLQAMAMHLDAIVIKEPLVGDVQDAAQKVIETIQSNSQNGPFAIAFGGETTVNITGTGKGGRNQELALRVAQQANLTGFDRSWCFLSGGTDGRDGPTDAAGGIVDHTTVARLADAKVNLDQILQDNNSYHALKTVDDLLMIGSTGTNVADLQLFIMD